MVCIAQELKLRSDPFILQLMIFEDLELPTHKTKNIVNLAKQMENTKKLLVVDGGPITEKLKLATSNLHSVNVVPSIVSFRQLYKQYYTVIYVHVGIYIWRFEIYWLMHVCMQGLNVYSILLHDTLLMSRDAVNKIVERMHTPINR